MRDTIQPVSATPEPPPEATAAGAAFVFGEAPEDEWLGRTVFRLDLEPLRDIPFAADAIDPEQAAQERGLRAARHHAVKQDIADNLGRRALSVTMLAARHGLTPRSLQRLFETEGTTFTEYVLAQRLARARRLLRDPRHAGDKISAVAYDCGFGDISHFNRMFRRQFGAAPSDIRAEACERRKRR